MSSIETQSKLSPGILKKALSVLLFSEEDEDVEAYAVLDGASIPDLLEHLYADPRPEFVCLYRGELEPDIAEVAPYLVRLRRDTPFTDWLLVEGWGKHWGIFAITTANLMTMRKHFRTFLMVKTTEGKSLYFRYYDPRVLPRFLPTCTAEEIATVFGPVQSYLCEDKNPATGVRLRAEAGRLKKDSVRLVEGEGP